jgi:hypothetical protein
MPAMPAQVGGKEKPPARPEGFEGTPGAPHRGPFTSGRTGGPDLATAAANGGHSGHPFGRNDQCFAGSMPPSGSS